MLAHHYLHLDHAYCIVLGGLRWSSDGQAIETSNGKTFAFAEEIAQFLEGFAAQRPLIHFCHLLHAMFLLRPSHRTVSDELVWLRNAYMDAHAPLRNAGSLFGALSVDIAEVPGNVSGQVIVDLLRNLPSTSDYIELGYHKKVDQAEATTWLPGFVRDGYVDADELLRPAVGPYTFEQTITAALKRITLQEVFSWLKHGAPAPARAAEQLVAEIPPPRSVGDALSRLLQTPRLAGAEQFVPQLVSALTLPSPRLKPQELPMGGYNDVVSKGKLEQLLPSQFVLDDDEFFRRYAANELLYFRRDEPQSKVHRELVIILDQGVRTWGKVRLVLSAAVVALARQADRMGMDFLLTSTSMDGNLIDPLDLEPKELQEIVEASDLSAHPAEVLSTVLEQPSDIARDIVLLTHRRALQSEQVKDATRQTSHNARLFAVALDESGLVDLVEYRHGGTVPIRQFRVDMTVQTPVAAAAPRPPADSKGFWIGAVEPVGFPFRFGIDAPIAQIDFDYDGRYLYVVTRTGTLYACSTDDGELEVLSRPMFRDSLFKEPPALCGVDGGFVLAGYLRSHLTMVHYRMNQRQVVHHDLWPAELPAKSAGTFIMHYHPACHAVILTTKLEEERVAVDLNTGQFYTRDQGASDGNAKLAYEDSLLRPRRRLTVWHMPQQEFESAADRPQNTLNLDYKTGVLSYFDSVQQVHRTFTPLSDGKPALRSSNIHQAQFCNRILAVIYAPPPPSNQPRLAIYCPMENRTIAEYSIASLNDRFALSRDGKLLARHSGGSVVQLDHISGGSTPLFRLQQGRFHNRVTVVPTHRSFFVQTGVKHFHRVSWEDGTLRMYYSRDTGRPSSSSDTRIDDDNVPLESLATLPGIPCSPLQDLPNYFFDSRFITRLRGDLDMLVDRYGHIIVLDPAGDVLCIFFAFREQMGAWMKDGTRAGHPSIIGGPESPNARARMGSVLLRASCAQRRI